MKTIVISNQKGGVGKTTLSCHLAFFTSDRKIRTLVVDLDEGDLTSVFLPDLPNDNTLLVASQLFKNVKKTLSPYTISPYLSIIPADKDILNVDDLPLSAVETPRKNFAHFANEFDLCIIDTPPNLQRRMIAALTAADAVVSPVNIDSFSFNRLEKLQTTIANIISELNPNLKFLGVLPNKVNSLSANEKDAILEMKDSLGPYFIDCPIFIRSAVPIALANSLPVWRNATSGSQKLAAKELRRACETIIKKLGLLGG